MTDKTITVKLTEADMRFITESMTCNVPCSEDMTDEERATYEKMVSAKLRLKDKK